VINRWTALKRNLLDSKNFGLILGLLVFLFLGWVAFLSPYQVFTLWDRSLSDFYFKLRSAVAPEIQQEGAVLKAENKLVSPDIMILGIDNRSLDTLGRWPFSRSLHADLLNSLTRIKNTAQRERAVFFDFFFLDRERVSENDLAFAQAIADNDRVFLETIYSSEAQDADLTELQFQRLDTLIQRSGSLGTVKGPWKTMNSYLTVQAPLIPLAKHAHGHGFATFSPDHDDVFRRQNLVSKMTRVLQEYELSTLKPDTSDYDARFQRYVYTDKTGRKVTLPSPLTAEVVATLPALLARDGLTRQIEVEGSTDLKDIYVIQRVQDIFLPSITLALALEYWHKKPADAEVALGSFIRIASPELYDAESGSWSPAPYSEVRIPIDADGAMTINYMGPRSSENGSEYQTFPVRSYSSYATKAPASDPATWPETRQLGGKLIMVGPFSSGVADDEKNTPFGQMYGVEMHANALNTILMRNFLLPVPSWIAALVLLASILLIAFLAGRFSTLLSLLVTFLLVVAGFATVLVLFDNYSLVYPFSSLLTGLLTTFLMVVVYRALTEEREKRKTRAIFSKYVSPDVVSELLLHPPELGGVDKELTVLFSDIRGFTSLSEGMTPQELVNHLNLYLTAMTDLIHEYRGTLDKYVGDEIMCFWGAPLEQADHAVLASKCALRMMEVLKQMNAEWPENRKINIGIGLNSGVMTVGNMGSQGRMNYTLMGDNVNLGARLEGTNKEYLTNIIISENTYNYLEGQSVVRELDNIRVKGKNKPVLIYELVDFVDGIEAPAVAKKK
jgi:adenylate cyclase